MPLWNLYNPDSTINTNVHSYCLAIHNAKHLKAIIMFVSVIVLINYISMRTHKPINIILLKDIYIVICDSNYCREKRSKQNNNCSYKLFFL